jgi:predicted dehydrogenase
MARTRIGIIGCGNISEIYLANLTQRFANVEVAAVADMIAERAAAKAAAHGIAKACTVEEMLADPSIAVILNLTIPRAHAEVCLQALEAGKHVYTEKPLSVSLRDGERIQNLARKKGLRVGAAPDTFLGAGIQTCIRLINEGAIGAPVAANAFMMCHGHESWHPDPDFYYQPGGGPVFDMGPYYFTALLALLGPAERVMGSASTHIPRRVVGSGPKTGEVITVAVPTHITGTIDFACMATATFTMSFEIWHTALPCLEVHGTDGSLQVPDPNGFGGPVRIRSPQDEDWREVPIELPYAENSRGLGLAEMVDAIGAGRPHLASGDLALHALEIMHAVHDASSSGKAVHLRHQAPRPEPFPGGL